MVEREAYSERLYPLFSEDSWQDLVRSLNLSPRDVEIACGIIMDQPEEGIARRLHVSEHTVHENLRHLYQKLGVCSRVELIVRLAHEHLSRHGSHARGCGGTRVPEHCADGDRAYPLFGEVSWRELAAKLKLSPMQMEVACGIFRDEVDYRIARRLGISEHTAQRHIRRLYEKLEVPRPRRSRGSTVEGAFVDQWAVKVSLSDALAMMRKLGYPPAGCGLNRGL